VESIKHEERAILQLICDKNKDIILSSGAAGIAVWRFYKNSIIDTCHIMEKLYVLDGCNHWVSKMIYEPAFDRVYIMNDRSVKVFNLTRHAMQAELINAHLAPVTTACWYARNQFYLTGCRLIF
jgi:WD40 repeat protein